MHIPDGFLSTPVWATLDVVSLPAIGWISRRANTAGTELRAPLLGVLGAFVFAAQMINFPVAPGTSAHLVGGALLACTAGPAAAVIVMTAVLLIQALVFQDGGLLAFGANVFNLAIAGVFAAWVPYWLLAPTMRRVGIFLGGALSVIVSGLLALGELAISGVPVSSTLATVSLTMFAVSAVLEGAITVAAISAIERIHPDWIRKPQSDSKVLRVLALASVVIAGTGFVIASAWPDTLETIAERAGVADRETVLLRAPAADYQLSALPWEMAAKAAAGVIGVAIVYLLCVTAVRLTRRSE